MSDSIRANGPLTRMGLRTQTLQASNLRTPAGQRRAGSAVEVSAASVTPAVLNNGSNPNVVELIGEGLLSMFGSGGDWGW